MMLEWLDTMARGGRVDDDYGFLIVNNKNIVVMDNIIDDRSV